MDEVEKKTIEMQAKEKAKDEGGWFSYFFGSSKNEEEKKIGINEDEIKKLYNVLKADADSQAEAEKTPVDLARTDEYYWLVGEFTLGKGILKIQRDAVREKASFKEAIVLTLEGIKSKFQKRFKGLDIDVGIGDIVLSTFSSFAGSGKIQNVVACRNTLNSGGLPKSDLAVLALRILPPNTDMQFEMEAKAKSLRLYYLPLLMGRMLMFLGQNEVRSTTYYALNEFKDNTQDQIQAALEGKKSKILVTVESPVLLVPILKNNDPNSPVWCFKLGDITIKSKVFFVFSLIW